MTDPSANTKIHLALEIQSGLKTVDYFGLALGYSQLYPAPLNPLSQIYFPVAPRDQSLLVYCLTGKGLVN